MPAGGRSGPRASTGALRGVPWLRAVRALRRPAAFVVAAACACAGLYALARATPAFALRTVSVEGAPPALARDVRRALAPLAGRSLVGLDPDAVTARLAALPDVQSAAYDRAFPDTLVVFVRPERKAVVVRSGRASWLVSARGRVLRRVERGAFPRLPRLWLAASARLDVGERLRGRRAEAAVRAAVVAVDEGFSYRVHSIRAERAELAFGLSGGRTLRLGAATDLPLKLAVATAILPRLEPVPVGGPAELDVSTPERPVAGRTLNSEVELETSE